MVAERFFQVKQSLRSHPKISKLAKLLNSSKQHALGVVCDLIGHGVELLDEHGALKTRSPGDLDLAMDWPDGTTAALVKAKLVDRSRAGLKVHDWEEHQDRAMRARVNARDRQRRFREKAVTRDSRVSNANCTVSHGKKKKKNNILEEVPPSGGTRAPARKRPKPRVKKDLKTQTSSGFQAWCLGIGANGWSGMPKCRRPLETYSEYDKCIKMIQAGESFPLPIPGIESGKGLKVEELDQRFSAFLIHAGRRQMNDEGSPLGGEKKYAMDAKPWLTEQTYLK